MRKLIGGVISESIFSKESAFRVAYFVAIFLSSVTFLDVGQGSCAVLQLSSGENYLFDCGSTSRSKVGQYVLLPYLKYEGIQQLDGVFVSHPDEDHSNGVLELFALAEENDIAVEQLILPDIEDEASKKQLGELVAAAHGENLLVEAQDGCLRGSMLKRKIRIAYISQGDSWQCGGAKFLCLHPFKDYSGVDSNQYSQCIYVEFVETKRFGKSPKAQTLLLTGDVGKEAENDLTEAIKEYGIGNITVFQGAHHGSKYSNSEALLEVIRPVVTVISCGRNNSYGHPHKEALERLSEQGAVILTTPECGAIVLEIDDAVRVRTVKNN